jgi:hypothetical protein
MRKQNKKSASLEKEWTEAARIARQRASQAEPQRKAIPGGWSFFVAALVLGGVFCISFIPELASPIFSAPSQPHQSKPIQVIRT